MKRTVFVALGVLAATGLFSVAVANSSSGVDSPEDAPPSTVPYLVPDPMPTGYVDSGVGLSGQENGTTTAVSALIRPVDLSSKPTAEVCVEAPDRALCPEGDTQITRTVNGRPVKIALSGVGADLPKFIDYWKTVTLVQLSD